jgi:hypothetical protein
MFFVLIPIAWLALVFLFVSLGRIASHAAKPAVPPVRASEPSIATMTFPGLTVWECHDPVGLIPLALAVSRSRPACRSSKRRVWHADGHTPERRATRGRSGRCVAGS